MCQATSLSAGSFAGLRRGSLARSLPVSVAGSGGVSVPRCQSGDFTEELPPYVSELHCSFILELGLVWLQLHEVTPVWSLDVL